MTILLETPKEIVKVPEQRHTITQINIDKMVDIPEQRVVRVFIKETFQPITLWEGDDYTNIGQWTDQDVADRLRQIFA